MEISTVKHSRELQLSKLRNIKEHLNSLISKKRRLEIEIMTLKKSYSKKSKEVSKQQKQFRASLKLGIGNESLQEPAISQEIREIDELDKLIALEQLTLQEMFTEEFRRTNSIDSFLEFCKDLIIQ